LIIYIPSKKEGIKPSSVTTNSPLHTTEEGLHSQSYKDMKDLNIIRDLEAGVKGLDLF